jgi:diguanylate cyclase (GGDEF)-like protein
MFALRYKSVKSLENMAYLDPITGGYNWNKFKIEVGKTLLTDYDKQYALVMLDVGKFKVLNDRYGYVRCNDLLKHMESVLDQAKLENEIIARMNADNFGFLAEYDDNNKLVNRLIEIEEKVKGFNKAYNINLSFGIYIIQDKKASISRICDNAHFAKQSTKNVPKSNYGFYDKQLIEDIHLQERIEVNMKKALEDNIFQVWYQPKYNIMDDTFVGAEALARWNDKDLGFISPGEFIPIAEKNGTVTKIDMYILRQVCKDIRAWMDKGVVPIPVSVNFSRLNLENDDFILNLNQIIKEYDVPSNLIEIELTENICLNNRKDLFDIIKRLKDDGFVVDMDDFGSGYSSLGLLKDIPVDVLKLDREFLVSSFNEERARKVISNIVLLSKDINIKLVAEGVETKEQVDFLKEINCEIVQGFYFARPMPISEFEDLVFVVQ